jgi:menaquinone-9 beta-reductase
MLQPEKFDVVIVGGGPAGSAAAFKLAGHGFKVCVVDKSAFPRDKLCGGLLTLRSKKIFRQIFETDWSPAIHRNSRGATFYFTSTRLNSVTDYKDIAFTCRREFDAMLLGLAIQRGATLRAGNAVKMIDSVNNTVTLAGGEVIAFNYLIGADGVNSAVARGLFGAPFNPRTIGFGFELEVPLGGKVQQIPDPEIYFGLINWGYGWVFPKRDTLTVGVGGSLAKNPDMRAGFEKFLVQRFGEIPTGKLRGHHIPFGDFRRVPGRDNILLCGDAAGLVEPITGEGIAFAMQSGYFAAEAICDAATKNAPATALGFYQARYQNIAKAFNHANRLRYLLFPKLSQRIFSKILPRTQSIPRRHMDLMADEIEYADYAKSILRTAISAPFCQWKR